MLWSNTWEKEHEMRCPFRSSGILTLLTDFGLADPFVGMMKGAIACVSPSTRVIDITHEIAPQDVETAAFVLARSYPYFPSGTVHVAVVDPGVGTTRKPIAIAHEGHIFVGPDNGILTLAAPRGSVVELDRLAYFRETVSTSFHGRDVFAPVAAHLSSGVPIASVGSRLVGRARLRWPAPRRSRAAVRGRIIATDRFGNLITNLEPSHTRAFRRPVFRVAGQSIEGIRSAYAEVPEGEPLALFDGYGLLEIAIRNGSAREVLGLQKGDDVVLTERTSTDSSHSGRARQC
jgi:S-adenosyl-L-methionine hydrolase (adenosine-forming)